MEKPSLREAATEDVDEVLAAEELRHEFPSLARLRIAGKGSLHHRRWIELGFHGFHQIFSGMLSTAEPRVFFFDFADSVVNMLARGVGKGIEEFLQAFGLAEFAGEDGVDIERHRQKTISRMTRIEPILTVSVGLRMHRTIVALSTRWSMISI
jgi:hypothetical protein